MKTQLLAILFIFSLPPCFYADVPLPPPQQHRVESPSKRFYAIVDPEEGIEVHEAISGQLVWRASNIWSRSVFLADDGEHLVTGYDGFNLIPLDYSKNLVLIRFWRRNKNIRNIKVSDLFPNTDILVRTVSHYMWGSIVGISGYTLTVKRCDKKESNFDIRTGKIQL